MTAAKSLTPAELETALTYIATRPHAVRNRVMLLVTVMAGLRVGEVADLTLADVRNRDGSIKREIYLASDRVKHGYARTVYVSTRLQAELAAYVGSRTWHEPTQPLFYTHRGPRRGFSANTLSQHFFWLYRRAGISNASSHSGRRSLLTSLAAKGVSVRVLQEIAGHSSMAITQRYIDVNDHQMRAAIELL